ncbi:MAG: DUF1987 domain-containing protein [Cytophagaceae bacterium]|nr:DUF1987 domain-containing protein [Cytophagaceae bacterium]
MQSLEIPFSGPKSLQVSFQTSGIFSISGISCDEDPKPIYKQMENWLSEYAQQPSNPTLLTIRLKYFNTASAKYLLSLLNQLVTLVQKDVDLQLIWFSEEADEDMQDTVKIFEDLIKHPITIQLVDSY